MKHLKVKKVAGRMEVWGTELEKPDPRTYNHDIFDAADRYSEDEKQWYSSFQFIAVVKPESEEGFKVLTFQSFVVNTPSIINPKEAFPKALSEGIIIPGDRVRVENVYIGDKPMKDFDGRVVGGERLFNKHAILVDPKEEGEDELWEEVYEIMSHTDIGDTKLLKQKFTIKRR